MDSKFLLCILTSSNEKLLRVSYESALHQNNHNLDYTIVIIVNSLNPEYYNDVCVEFQSDNVEIIQTKSNGKPGMGHNSVITLFKNRIQYDYMLLLDGDDFLYPSALEQLEKCFKIHTHIDMISLKSTDKLKYIENDELDFFDINLNNNFCISSKIYVEHKLFPWNNTHMNLSNFYNNTLCTPIRLFLLHRNIFNYHKGDLFHSECKLYDDYLTFLYFIKYSFNPNLKCFIIPGKYIYLYNSININSLTHTTEENDIELYETYKNEFSDCLLYLSDKWDLTKLPTLYISHKYEKKYECKINEETYSISMNLNYPDIVSDLNYLYIKTRGIEIINNVIQSYYDITLVKFMKNNLDKSLFYGRFFNEYQIKNGYISFIILFSIHKIYNKTITHEYLDIFKKNILSAHAFTNFYNIDSLHNYIDFIKNINV
mgnify:FL=1|tara:strand:- start:186 stop:1469 length:1284 start_codon:yes stop_codon:yes gene_type:complete